MLGTEEGGKVSKNKTGTEIAYQRAGHRGSGYWYHGDSSRVGEGRTNMVAGKEVIIVINARLQPIRRVALY